MPAMNDSSLSMTEVKDKIQVTQRMDVDVENPRPNPTLHQMTGHFQSRDLCFW